MGEDGRREGRGVGGEKMYLTTKSCIHYSCSVGGAPLLMLCGGSPTTHALPGGGGGGLIPGPTHPPSV